MAKFMEQKIKEFEKAFSTRSGHSTGTCNCGREFYNPNTREWSFENGELEALEKSKATAVGYAVEFIHLEGRNFVIDCNCWQERVEKIIGWIDAHAHSIVDYLKEEKKRKASEANWAADIDL